MYAHDDANWLASPPASPPNKVYYRNGKPTLPPLHFQGDAVVIEEKPNSKFSPAMKKKRKKKKRQHNYEDQDDDGFQLQRKGSSSNLIEPVKEGLKHGFENSNFENSIDRKDVVHGFENTSYARQTSEPVAIGGGFSFSDSDIHRAYSLKDRWKHQPPLKFLPSTGNVDIFGESGDQQSTIYENQSNQGSNPPNIPEETYYHHGSTPVSQEGSLDDPANVTINSAYFDGQYKSYFRFSQEELKHKTASRTTSSNGSVNAPDYRKMAMDLAVSRTKSELKRRKRNYCDYVLVYEANDKDVYHVTDREKFQKSIERKGLTLVETEYDGTIFVEIYANFELLMEEAEKVNLQMPLTAVS